MTDSVTPQSEKDHLARGFAMGGLGLGMVGIHAAGAMHDYGLILATGIALAALIEIGTHYFQSFRRGGSDV